jgi:hypothetical protein
MKDHQRNGFFGIDVDADTFCLNVDTVEAVRTARTRFWRSPPPCWPAAPNPATT